ncbi:glutaminyl-peptide cyclotransferase [Sphingobacterium spiritivorum]|uniref:Glutamine cyclotransferase n=1 Tax=Sphingobacterium spiritivorum ATCC 33861 TaxID=525373 RepID=D7VI41_SPHSI|nr:glutaminyl-peptide cyclotransferase [Sphingobacterium spiritivorum]EFK59743.1 glutamine cyclotransferase [Sphingobacterium spiritivorum ATCC 33861]QQT37610.1 glutaminyl-peptide cyclotransferase [Sphingobacterium spiritivorum]WQD34408.1 glutaminyl-peptide cyclotransferase [Sphingobacterium spiritivorum]SUI97353.1 Glutamine cyclotransferase [Sphingobacterium spiritivorum]
MKKIIGVFAVGAMLLSSCFTKKGKLEFVSPESGKVVILGQKVNLKLNFASAALDSVVYSVDGNIIGRKQDTSSLVVDSQTIGLGNKNLTAKVYAEGKEDMAYSNVLIVPESAKQYGFEIINTFPHDTSAFTQGLEFADGIFYESTGRYGLSSLRKVEVNTGKVLKKLDLDSKYFGEGMTIFGNKIVLLTWENNMGLVFDKATFNQTGTFNYENSKEGWGLTNDGQRLIKSDGSNKLYFLNPETYKEEGSIGVYDENGAVEQLNELEYIDGKVYANVYQKDIIVIIDPKTGAVTGQINLVGMYTNPQRQSFDNELNGIAYDKAGKRLFLTGKKWNQLFEVKLVER